MCFYPPTHMFLFCSSHASLKNGRAWYGRSSSYHGVLVKMKLKCRVTSLLALLAVSSLFITFKLFKRLENNIGEEITRSKHEEELTVVSSDYSMQVSNLVITTQVPAVVLSETLKEKNATFFPWEVWSSWVKPTKLYPVDSFYSPTMNSILSALSTSPITKFGIGYRGTQLKATMYLNKTQRTVFKPKRYHVNTIDTCALLLHACVSCK